MKFVLYAHSVVSDWNNGNAHFLRGILSELAAARVIRRWRWSRKMAGAAPIWSPIKAPPRSHSFAAAFPHLHVTTYETDFDHEAALDDADVVIVHEWTPPDLVARIGRLRRGGGRFVLLFHDTHHRGVSDAGAIERCRCPTTTRCWHSARPCGHAMSAWAGAGRAFTWHEAADTHRVSARCCPMVPQRAIWSGSATGAMANARRNCWIS